MSFSFLIFVIKVKIRKHLSLSPCPTLSEPSLNIVNVLNVSYLEFSSIKILGDKHMILDTPPLHMGQWTVYSRVVLCQILIGPNSKISFWSVAWRRASEILTFTLQSANNFYTVFKPAPSQVKNNFSHFLKSQKLPNHSTLLNCTVNIVVWEGVLEFKN